MSQGVLQAIFEYQTVICELTGMDVSNASGYDGTTVAADACFVAKHTSDRSKVVLAETLNPQVRQVVKTYAPGFGLDVVEVPHRDGTTDPEELGRRRGGCRRRDLPAAELLRLPRAGARPRGRRAATRERTRSRTSTSMTLGVLEAPGDVRLRDGDRRGAGGRQLAARTAARTTASSRARRSSSAGCPAASSARRSTPTGGARSF